MLLTLLSTLLLSTLLLSTLLLSLLLYALLLQECTKLWWLPFWQLLFIICC